MSTRLDHFMLAVDDLAAAAAELSGSGLAFADGGQHPTGTANALLVPAGRWAYVELITAGPDADNDVAGAVRRGGLVAYALSVDDLDAAVRDLAAVGFECATPAPGSRTTTDGRQIRWRSATVGSGFGLSDLPFLIEWPAGGVHRTGLTPDTHGATLTEIELGSHDPDRLAQLLRALGLDVTATGDALTCFDGEVTIRVVEADPHIASVVLDRGDGTRLTMQALIGEQHDSIELVTTAT